MERLAGKRVRLSIRLCDEPVLIFADRGNVEQVLFNLAVNARDAIDDTGEVDIALEVENGDHALLSVRDTGVGITQEVIPHIFEPFFTTKAEGKGTGLGLATVQRIVTEVNGRIDLETVEGEGTTFYIRIPLCGERSS